MGDPANPNRTIETDDLFSHFGVPWKTSKLELLLITRLTAVFGNKTENVRNIPV